MPFGMKNAPATFQRMTNKLVRDTVGGEGYIDDVVIYSDNWSDHACCHKPCLVSLFGFLCRFTHSSSLIM